jgi:hypothetical protein
LISEAGIADFRCLKLIFHHSWNNATSMGVH